MSWWARILACSRRRPARKCPWALAPVLRDNGRVSANHTRDLTHTANARGAAWLGAAHFLVDTVSVAAVLRASPPGNSTVASALAFVLGYDLLAFAGQAPLGWLVDRFAVRRGAALVGVALCALALWPGPESRYAVVALAGIGNALFHVGAGAMVLAGSRGRATPAGIFVAPGALGLGLGILLGRKLLAVPLWPLGFGIAVTAILIWQAAEPADEIPAAPISAPGLARGEVAAVMVLLAFSVAVRSLVGTVGCDACPRGFYLFLALPAAAFTGKIVGGLLADRFGCIEVSTIALLASAPLLAFSGGDPWLALPAIAIFQLTMPVTLAAALRALPAWPGFGFGVLCVALVGGTLPAYLPGGWRPHGMPLLLLVLASAAALFLALRWLEARSAVPTASSAVVASASSPSTLCKGLS
jgi:FSR family fosmidomycin resistance protein-like MFS transporter